VLEPIDLRSSALLLDIDGTLIDIAPSPGEVRVPHELRETLACLRAKTSGALALVSGRPLSDIERLFAALNLSAVGGHGAEMRLVTERAATEHRAAPLEEGVRRRLVALANTHGVLVEDKGASVAVHYRSAPERQQEIHAAVAAITAELPPGTVEVLAGKAVVEIKRTGFNKGTAIHEILRHEPFAGRRPVFVGDDVTDEAAFAAVLELGGVALSVGRDFPGLAGRFETPADVRHWLAELCASAESV
jgi:trehalose 6-phosphate phosphatase